MKRLIGICLILGFVLTGAQDALAFQTQRSVYRNQLSHPFPYRTPRVYRQEKREAQRKQREKKRLISASVAKKRAEASYGGRALSAKLFQESEDVYYKIKLIKQGRVKFVRISAER